MIKVLFQILSGFKYLVLGLLLISFIQISIPNYLHHCESHAEDPVLHDTAEESDPCHRAIYHGDLHHGCNHPQHISKGLKKCGLEDLFYVFHVELPDIDKPFCLIFQSEEIVFNLENVVLNDVSVYNIRGPPICI